MGTRGSRTACTPLACKLLSGTHGARSALTVTHDGRCEDLPSAVVVVPPALLCCACEADNRWVLVVLDVHHLELRVAVYTHHVLSQRSRLVQNNLHATNTKTAW